MSDLDRYQYGYDQNSNRLWKANVVGTPVVSGGLDEYYTYDNLNRLTEMQRGTLNSGKTGISGTPSREMDYTLDPTGNWSAYLTKTSGTTDLNQTRSHSPVNEITAIGGTPAWATPPAYDPAGNMNSFPQPGSPFSAYTAVYDAWNRMVSVSASGSTVAQYQYDGANRRAVKETYSGGTLSETRHFYYTSDWQDVEERVGTSTSMDKQFAWGIRYVDELICRDDATPERLYASQDANFNVTAFINTSGSVEQRFLYDPYGNSTVLTASWASTSDAYAWAPRFTGQFFDLETQLYCYRARYYHPVLGRFAVRDPMEYMGTMNLYLYTHGDPVALTDPTGHYAVCCRPVQMGWPQRLAVHCNLVSGNCPGGDTSYPVDIDTSSSRVLENCNVPCSQASAADIASCLKKYGYGNRSVPYPPGVGLCSIGGGIWGNNCQTATLIALSACCMLTHWIPNSYAGPIPPCLSYQLDANNNWVCAKWGPDPIYPVEPQPPPGGCPLGTYWDGEECVGIGSAPD